MRGRIFWGMQASCYDAGGRFEALRYKFFKELKVDPKNLFNTTVCLSLGQHFHCNYLPQNKMVLIFLLSGFAGWTGLTRTGTFCAFLASNCTNSEPFFYKLEILKLNPISTATQFPHPNRTIFATANTKLTKQLTLQLKWSPSVCTNLHNKMTKKKTNCQYN